MLLMELSFPIKQQELRKKTRIKKSLKTALRKKRCSVQDHDCSRGPLKKHTVGAIDNPGRFEHVFDTCHISESSEKFSLMTFRWLIIRKCTLLVFAWIL